MAAAVTLGLALAWGAWVWASGWYNAHCYWQAQPQRLQAQFCETLTRSPPWLLLSSLAAAPAVLLTWYWRTTHKNTDILQKQRDLDLAERVHARQIEEAKTRAAEVQAQLALQKDQIAAAASNTDRQIKASAEQQAKQLAANAEQAEQQLKASAEQQSQQLRGSAEQQAKQIEANAAQQREQQLAREKEQAAQQATQAAELVLRQEQAQARAEEVKQQLAAGIEANAIARETHLLDTYLRAVKALGTDDLQEHLAGVTLLGQLGRDSERYAKAVVEVLAAFIRRNVERRPQPGDKVGSTSSTVVAALNALMQVPKAPGIAADLSRCAFKGFNLQDGDLGHTDFTEAWFELVDFQNVRFDRAKFTRSTAAKVGFSVCSIRGARFAHCKWTEIEAWDSTFDASQLWNASIDGQSYGSTFQKARYNEASDLPIVVSEGGTYQSQGLTTGPILPE